MKSKSRIEIVTERTREVSFRVKRRLANAETSVACATCGGELVSINEAAQNSAFGWREIVRLVETGAVHSAETGAGEIYVCAASLSAGK